MNASKLAMLMLAWEEAQKKANAMKWEIQKTVLSLGETQKVGDVTAKYSAGRKSYDYMGAAVGAPDVTDETILLYTKTITIVDWRKLCKEQHIVDVPFTKSAPSVSVKLK